MKFYLIYQIFLHPDVPIGKDENDNIEVLKSGKLPKFTFTPKSHFTN